MDTHDASGVPEILALAKEQKKNLQAALLRKGQPPQRQPRWAMVNQFLWKLEQKLQAANSQTFSFGTSFVPPPYPPCVTPFSELTKAMIGELVLETQHRGKYLLVRCVTPQDRMTAVVAVVEDEEGETVLLQLYHQEHPEQPLEELLIPGRAVIVKEPYLKATAGGGYGLRVDHVSDVEFLSPMDQRIPDAWRKRPVENTAASWKVVGNELFKMFRYRAAIEAYTEALSSSPTDEEHQTITLNRSLVHLKTRSFDKALADANVVALSPNPSEKAPFRKAEALYGLSQFRECCDVLKVLCSEYPNNSAAKDLFRRAVARLSEKTHGRYNFKAMHAEAAKLRPPHLDHATFVGPVAVRASGISPGGRGLFTTAAVSAGHLLLCEKAFAHAFADESEGGKNNFNVTILIDTTTDNMTMGAQAELVDRLVRKLHQNPSLSKAVTDLHHGEYQPVDTTSVDGSPIVDTFLLRRIIPLNTFGCPLTTLTSHPLNTPASAPRPDKSSFHSCGIWPLASYINHSCTSNSRRAFIGDMMLVRATRDLPPDTELTWWYDPPPTEPTAYLERQKSLRKNWGFMCKCGACREARDTPGGVLEGRMKLWREVRTMVGSPTNTVGVSVVRKAEKVVGKLEATYKRPPGEAPRLGVSTWQVILASRYRGCGQPVESVRMALEALGSLGFVVDGGNIREGAQGPVVREWGLMADHVVDCWMFLVYAYQLVAPEWVGTAETYAKTAYRICFGEDETFEKSFGGGGHG